MTRLSARHLAQPASTSDRFNGPREIFCSPGMPPDWLPRPATIVTDFGWIVGTPRRSRTPSRPVNSFSRTVTQAFVRAQAANSPRFGMP
jgi:hypothetical protein